MATKPRFQHDYLHRLTKVHWAGKGIIVVIESNHHLTNNGLLILRGTTGIPLVDDTPESPPIGIKPPDEEKFPKHTVSADDPALVFPPSKEMVAYYRLWNASKIDFPTGDPADRSSIQDWIVNPRRIPTPKVADIKLRLKYTIPADVPLSARVNAYVFDHFDFELVTTNQAGPAVRNAPGKADAIFQVQLDLNAGGGDVGGSVFKECDIVISRVLETITLTGIV